MGFWGCLNRVDCSKGRFHCASSLFLRRADIHLIFLAGVLRSLRLSILLLLFIRARDLSILFLYSVICSTLPRHSASSASISTAPINYNASSHRLTALHPRWGNADKRSLSPRSSLAAPIPPKPTTKPCLSAERAYHVFDWLLELQATEIGMYFLNQWRGTTGLSNIY